MQNAVFGKWMWRLALAPLVGAAMMMAGCESEDTDSEESPTRLVIERELINYSDTDTATWETTLSQAMLTVKIDDFFEGDTSLVIYDGAGKRIFAGALNTSDSVYFNGNDLFFQQLTQRGTPGRWTIVADYDDFTGDIDITLQ
jgi:hypothetical protein